MRLLLLLVLVWDETGGRGRRCRIAALMDVAAEVMMLRLEVLIRMIRVVWMMGLMLLMVLMVLMLLLLLLICGEGATVDAALLLLLPRRDGMRGG